MNVFQTTISLLSTLLLTGAVWCQQNKPEPVRGASEGATIKGSVEFDPSRSETWNGERLVVPLDELTVKLFEQVELVLPPYPRNFEEFKPEDQQEWARRFEESDEGKNLIAENDKRIAAAKSYDVLIEKSGQFVVYDVPPGIYGIRGRVDKELKGTLHGFEVFGQIEVAKEMDEIRLAPLLIEVTPLLRTGEVAPPISVQTHDKKNEITLEHFKDHYVLITFWITQSPSADYQPKIQEAFDSLKEKYPIRLLSICTDEKSGSGVSFILEKQLRNGSHGFTEGWGHRTLFDYGVRAIPSFWLIGPDGKILMAQQDFAMAFRQSNDLVEIISNRIEGKHLPEPTPATESDKPGEGPGEGPGEK